MDFHGVEVELNRMKAETLGDTGRKLEVLTSMVRQEESYIQSTSQILLRAEKVLADPKTKSRKKKLMIRLKERLEQKLARARSGLRQMKAEKEKNINNIKMQREALGLTDQSWIDRFYGDDAK